MIRVSVYRNTQGGIYGFNVDDHGDAVVCAAVSALTLNTVNSIEAFCGDIIGCEYDDEGGYLSFSIPVLATGGENHDATLLLNALLLGLIDIESEYPQHITIDYK